MNFSSKIFSQKKGDVPWWLVMLILALLFLAIFAFVGSGMVKKFLISVGVTQNKTDTEQGCLVILGGGEDQDGDGYRNSGECDCDDTDPDIHGPKENCQSKR